MTADLEEFFTQLAQRTGTAALDQDEADAVLLLAKVVAHASERRFAPLACYAAGRALSSTDAVGRLTRIRDITAAVRSWHEQSNPGAGG